MTQQPWWGPLKDTNEGSAILRHPASEWKIQSEMDPLSVNALG